MACAAETEPSRGWMMAAGRVVWTRACVCVCGGENDEMWTFCGRGRGLPVCVRGRGGVCDMHVVCVET